MARAEQAVSLVNYGLREQGEICCIRIRNGPIHANVSFGARSGSTRNGEHCALNHRDDGERSRLTEFETAEGAEIREWLNSS
jgi:hypothetical protein